MLVRSLGPAVAADAFGNALGDSLVEEMKFSGLPEEVRKMSNPDRERALRLAQTSRMDLTDPAQAQELVDTMQMSAQGRDLGAERREQITLNALRRMGLSDEQVSAARTIYAEQGLVRDREPATQSAAPESPTDSVTTGALELVVITGRHPDIVLGSRALDQMAMGVGGLTREVQAQIKDRPWLEMAITAVQFLAAPLAYMANQVVALSPIGQAIGDKLVQIHGAMTELFVDANYGVNKAVDGASGVMTVGGLAAGFGAKQAMAMLGVAIPRSVAQESSRLRPGHSFTLTNVQDKYPDIALTQDIRRQMGPKPTDMVNPHAHHILEVNGQPGQHRATVREGQDILREYGIDPLHGPENLIYAPNKGHTLTNAETLVSDLRAAKSLGEPRDVILKILRDAGEAARTR